MQGKLLRTLIYKRTHNGDPDQEGRFGIHDCMGTVRGREYEAVIGVGGTGPEPQQHGIAKRINWIGIGPHKAPGPPDHRGPLVTFDHFLYYGATGPWFSDLAREHAAHIYRNNVRTKMVDSEKEPEIETILALAKEAPPSTAMGGEAPTARGTEPPEPMSGGDRCRPKKRC